MKILFTMFTPPYAQGYLAARGMNVSFERSYLEYQDWLAVLRKCLSMEHEVRLFSLTNKNNIIEIEHDGTKAVFFPVIDSTVPAVEGRWDLDANGVIDYMFEFNPDVIHVIGVGHKLSLDILETKYGKKVILWERVKFDPNIHPYWDDIDLASYYVLPTKSQLDQASNFFNRKKLLNFPMGANINLFHPISVKKKFDIISVGSVNSKRKKINIIKRISEKNQLSWINIGGVVKGWPFHKWEDILFMSGIRRSFHLRRVKKAKYYNHISGFFKNEETPLLYNQSKILVQPSAVEGASRAVNEALACEIPVIVSRQGAPYIESDFGIVCDSDKEIEDAILELLCDDDRRIQMGKRGREWLIEEHGPDKLCSMVNEINMRV